MRSKTPFSIACLALLSVASGPATCIADTWYLTVDPGDAVAGIVDTPQKVISFDPGDDSAATFDAAKAGLPARADVKAVTPYTNDHLAVSTNGGGMAVAVRGSVFRASAGQNALSGFCMELGQNLCGGDTNC